jgi:hypothetical protein
MHYLIYKITNKLDNKIYIGKHQTENDLDDYFGSGLLLERAIEKYGKEYFSKEIVCRLNSLEELNEMEKKIVDEEFISRDDTYNIKLGGQGGWDHIIKNKLNLTEKLFEVCRENAKALKERHLNDPEFRKFHSDAIKLGLSHHPLLGRTVPDDTRAKMSKAKKGKYDGKNNPSFGSIWINNGVIAKKIKNTDTIPEGFVRGTGNLQKRSAPSASN